MAGKTVTTINIDSDLKRIAKERHVNISGLMDRCLRAEIMRIVQFEEKMSEVI